MVSVEQELSNHGSSEISIFAGSTEVSDQQLVSTTFKLGVAFPDMKKEFFDLLTEQVIKSGMTSKRLEYALNTVLNTHRYNRLKIADVLNHDIKCKVYSYTEMCDEIHKNNINQSYYAPIRIGDSKKVSWVTRADKERYSLPDRI